MNSRNIDREAVNETVAELMPGAVVVATCPDTERRLTVERFGRPEWSTVADKPSFVLSGYGTEYHLSGDRNRELLPMLRWPSVSLGTFVLDLEVEEPGVQIVSDVSAEDLGISPL